MKHLIAAIILSSIVSASTVVTKSQHKIGKNGDWVMIVCVDGYKWLATRNTHGLNMQQSFIEKKPGVYPVSVPEKCQ